MKKFLTPVAAMLVMLLATRGNAQQVDQAAAMKAWNAYMTPGSVHKMLAKADGKWKTETTMWMDPSAQPMKSTGECTNRMILGGRYQESINTGTAMGKPFEGRSLLGYDNAKKMFISTWVDNMGTGVMTMEGVWDEGARTINFRGREVDPMTGQDMPVRETFRIIDDNHQVMEMFVTTNGGAEYKMMEITFTRMGAK